MSRPLTLTARKTGLTYAAHHLHAPEEPVFEGLKGSYRTLITAAGENAEREGLLKTPERAAKAWQFLTSGYQTDPVEILRSALFEEEYRDMVLVNNIEFFSQCEHHLLPFYGKAHVAYLPSGRIVGLSKIPRMVDAFARRLQVQERLTQQIADALQETLDPAGIAVMIEATHMCMMIRGVQKQHSATTTSTFRGLFETDDRKRDLFLSAVGNASR